MRSYILQQSFFNRTWGLLLDTPRSLQSIIILLAFLVNTLGPLPLAQAQEFALPAPGQMVALSPAYNPAVLKGIKLDPQNPFRFYFYVDTGDSVGAINNRPYLKNESARLIKYFLASLTIPEKDLWVNLSPYEKDRIVPQEFGQTEMGRDLLAEDYILKQITASLIYPESKLGKEFWTKVYAQAQAKYGTTNISVNTFNKVWIVPDKAVVYENNGTAFVLENHLKVMLEKDYLSTKMHSAVRESPTSSKLSEISRDSSLASSMLRAIVNPALTKEVNEGKNFSQLRQVFYSLILATWYKKKIKDSILNKIYSNRKKIQNLSSPNDSAHGRESRDSGVGDPQYIYQQYLKAFKKGVFNYIKDSETPNGVSDTSLGQSVPRKYFSGGVEAYQLNIQYKSPSQVSKRDFAQLGTLFEVTGDTSVINQNSVQPSGGPMNTSISAKPPQKKIWELANTVVAVHQLDTPKLINGSGSFLAHFPHRIALTQADYYPVPAALHNLGFLPVNSFAGEFIPRDTEDIVFIGGSLKSCLRAAIFIKTNYVFQHNRRELVVYLPASLVWLDYLDGRDKPVILENVIQEIKEHGEFKSVAWNLNADNFLKILFQKTLMSLQFYKTSSVIVRLDGEEHLISSEGNEHRLIIDIVRDNELRVKDRAMNANVQNNIFGVSDFQPEHPFVLSGRILKVSDYGKVTPSEGLVEYAKTHGVKRVYFDLDLTVFRSKGYLSSSAWFENTIKEFGTDQTLWWWGNTGHENRQIDNGFFYRLMDENLPRMIEELRAANIEVTGLTARDSSQDKSRTGEILERFGIKMDGVIFSSGASHKGEVLDEFEGKTAKLGLSGKVRSLFVEDSFGNLLSVLKGREHVSGVYYVPPTAHEEDLWDYHTYLAKAEASQSEGNSRWAFEYYYNAFVKLLELNGITRQEAQEQIGNIYEKLLTFTDQKPKGYDQLLKVVNYARSGRSRLFHDDAARALRKGASIPAQENPATQPPLSDEAMKTEENRKLGKEYAKTIQWLRQYGVSPSSLLPKDVDVFGSVDFRDGYERYHSKLWGSSVERQEKWTATFEILRQSLYRNPLAAISVLAERPGEVFSYKDFEDRIRHSIFLLQGFKSLVDSNNAGILQKGGFETERQQPVSLDKINAIFVPEEIVAIIRELMPDLKDKIVEVKGFKKERFDPIHEFQTPDYLGAISTYFLQHPEFKVLWVHAMRLKAPSDFSKDEAMITENAAALRLLKEKGFPVFDLARIAELTAKTEQFSKNNAIALGISHHNAELVALNRKDIVEEKLSSEVDTKPLGSVECRLYKQIGKNGLSTLWSDRLIPVMGEGIFHADGRLMNEEELRQAGLVLVKDDRGAPLSVRGLVLSRRTVSMPGPWVVPFIRTDIGEKVLSTYQEISQLAGNEINGSNITQTLVRLATEGRVSLRLAAALDFKGSGRYKFRPGKDAPLWLQVKAGKDIYVPALSNENAGDESWPTYGGVGALRETEAEHLDVQADLLAKGAVFSGLEIASNVLFDRDSLPELAGNADYNQVVVNQRVTFTLARASLFLYEWASDSGASLHTETLMPWLKTIYGIDDEAVIKDKFLEQLYRTLGRNLRAALLLQIYRDRTSRLPHNWGPNLELIDLGGLRRTSNSYDIREWEWVLMYVGTCLMTLTPSTTDQRAGPYTDAFFKGRYFNEVFLPAIFSGENLTFEQKYFDELQRRGHLETPSVLLGPGFIQRIKKSLEHSQHFDKAMKVAEQKELNGPGGIDLNPAQMSLQVKNEGQDFKFDFNGAQIDTAQLAGVTFTIRQMTPVTNLSEILGLNK